MTIDPNDLNQDGVVTRDELDVVTAQGRPKSFLRILAENGPRLLTPQSAAAAMPFLGTELMNSRQYSQRRDALSRQYPGAPSEAALSAGRNAAANADKAAASAQATAAPATSATTASAPGEIPFPGSSEKKTKLDSGYLGVDVMSESDAVTSTVGEDGVTRYWVDTKDGARQALYKEQDAYTSLASMGPNDLLKWRKAMWLGGYMEPKSFVGPMTMEDLATMQSVMTEANLTGNTWEGATASRIEMGARYGRPITEAEIAELDDDVPAMIKDYASKNGITVSDDFIARQQRRVLNGKDTAETVIAKLRDTYVKPMYPQFEKELDNGLTMQDIASPYIDTVSQFLEIPASQIDLNDPTIKKALQARDQSGQPVRMSLWELEDELTKDPRWQYTDNAYRAYESAVGGMISEMGL